MSVIFLCPFMDDSALPFIRARGLHGEETDLKGQVPELSWTHSAHAQCPHEGTCACGRRPRSDPSACELPHGTACYWAPAQVTNAPAARGAGCPGGGGVAHVAPAFHARGITPTSTLCAWGGRAADGTSFHLAALPVTLQQKRFETSRVPLLDAET